MAGTGFFISIEPRKRYLETFNVQSPETQVLAQLCLEGVPGLVFHWGFPNNTKMSFLACTLPPQIYFKNEQENTLIH